MNSSKDTIAPAIAPDPLMAVIHAYKRGLAEFNFKSFDIEDDEWSDLADRTYGPHLATLSNWDKPATTPDSAREALRITLTDQSGIYGCDAAVTCMIKAAYGFLKGASE